MRDQGRPAGRNSFSNRVRPTLEALEDRRLLSFAGALDFATGGPVRGLTAADVNHDGRPDVVTANVLNAGPASSTTVSVLLNTGGGTMAATVNYPVDLPPSSVLVRDVNGDGNPDIMALCPNTNATLDPLPGAVDVLLGNGDGTFKGAVSYVAGPLPNAFDLADFNGDGKPDLVVVGGGNGDVTIGSAKVLLNHGDGTFAAAVKVATGSNPQGVAAADFNGDGKADLAVSNIDPDSPPTRSAVQFLPGHGDGTFGAPFNLAYPSTPGAMVAADVNGDGRPDLAVANTNGYAVGSAGFGISLLLNNGDGTFRVSATMPLSNANAGTVPVVGDVNGDGKPDVAALDTSGFLSPSNFQPVKVYLGNGDGTVSAGLPVSVPEMSRAVLADLTGDGKLDLLGVAGGFTPQEGVNVLPGRGDGTFETLPAVDIRDANPPWDSPTALVTGDFNGDARVDFVAVLPDQVSTFLNSGGGTWGSQVDSPLGQAFDWNFRSAATADFNGDGQLDVVSVFADVASAEVYLNKGGGSFTPGPAVATNISGATLVTGDFNGDGKADFAVVSGNGVRVLLGHGDGTFAYPVATDPSGLAAAGVVSGDFNGDGRLDLVVDSPYFFDQHSLQMVPGNVTLLPGHGDGTFGNPIVIDTGTALAPTATATADWNHDGKPDLLVYSAGTYDPNTQTTGAGRLSVLLNRGNGTFAVTASLPVGGSYSGVLATDLDGDGRPDVVIQGPAAGTNTEVFPGNGDGTLGTPYQFSSGAGFGVMVAGDFNGDQRVDLAKLSGQTITLLNSLPPLDHVAVTGPSGAVDGSALTVTVSGLSKLGQPTGDYAGRVHFLSSDPTASLPADYSFGPADGGTQSFQVTLHKPGTQTVLVMDANTGQTLGSLNIRVAAGGLLVTGAGVGGGPEVRAYDAGHQLVLDFFAYNLGFTGGVRTAVADVTGDGRPDIITAPGASGGPDIRVFDGVTGQMVREIMAYSPAWTGGVYVAAADVNGDGFADIITGAGEKGGPHVRVFSGKNGSLLGEFMAYNPAFTGGVRVAAGDVDGDGTPDIITAAGPGGGPHVQVFSGKNFGVIRSFFAYDVRFGGGVYVAADDLNGDGHADIVTGAGAGGGPHVRAFSGKDSSVLNEFMAYDTIFTGGVRVAVADVNGDGVLDIVTGAGPGGGPHVRAFDALDQTALDGFFAYAASFTGGVFVGG